MYARGDDAADAAGGSGLAEPPADLRDQARRHPLRLAILALLASKRNGDRSLADLRAELPNSPAEAVVNYHLGVLRSVGLIRRDGDDSSAVYSLA